MHLKMATRLTMLWNGLIVTSLRASGASSLMSHRLHEQALVLGEPRQDNPLAVNSREMSLGPSLQAVDAEAACGWHLGGCRLEDMSVWAESVLWIGTVA